MDGSHAIAALVRKRADLAGQMEAAEKRLRTLQASLVHVDATIRLFDADYPIAEIAPKRAGYKPVLPGLFRYVLDTLRNNAASPLTAWDISKRIAAQLGMEDRHVNRIEKSVSAYLRGKEGKLVEKAGDDRPIRWMSI